MEEYTCPHCGRIIYEDEINELYTNPEDGHVSGTCSFCSAHVCFTCGEIFNTSTIPREFIQRNIPKNDHIEYPF